VSAIWQPVLHETHAVGVLGLMFETRTTAVPADVRAMLEALVVGAAMAIERDALVSRLTLVADRDPLTGLPNRRRWEETYTAETARAQRTQSHLSFVLVELNDFPVFTDRFGQLAGEGLLRQFASSVQSVLRDVDTIAHWGGAVFAVALPACSVQDASFVARRIRDVVPQGQTCTTGVAEWMPNKTMDQVLKEAESGLSEGWGSSRTPVRP
jgi:diguanylate cyclase (GGDEF)-like protein